MTSGAIIMMTPPRKILGFRMQDPDELFEALSRSRFRSRFALCHKDQEYFLNRGLELIMRHGREFIETRLAPAEPANDGRQTPMKGHPIFIGQHATGTCCRMLGKWHNIPGDRSLDPSEIDYVLGVLAVWLKKQKAKPLQARLPGVDTDTEPL